MGAWGIQFNECDGGLDFLGDLEESREWALVDRQIRGSLTDEGYEQGEETLAALEVVAAALGNPSPHLAENHKQWATQHESKATVLRETSVEAAQNLKSGSELAELWDEADESAEWRSNVDDLINRLKI